MAKLNVKFLRFVGKESLWNDKIASSNWDNSIVFGKVWDLDSSCHLKIYAGKDKDGSTYEYDMASFSKFIEIEKDVKELLNFLAVDSSLNFTSDKMLSALDNFINNNATVKDILYDITDINNRIDAMDISINDITVTLLQTIKWLDENSLNEWIEEEP